ncbi:protein-glutamate methylesterase/protein-glutamine glutaminase [Piscirickettsia litoralis]|uniref:Protein-glutamate methylesterase/protein-glutamine glutaminase n=1 Tax=Piscirickettsia litoralis TaxID=1891921 RepID=A0ABX3A399_9GAMM|nr:chemotaxis response regulator protein-glutamate methylesterase [Piscirickettsia litoralis]ODN42113.1 hypothetical protein BGC07_03065 [Piscirickettsia litoralis]
MIKVLIVDDSKLIQEVLTSLLSMDKEIEIVDVAEDPFDAREKIKRHNPDVITLDVEMPKMDGLTFLENLMRLRPMPVVMISTLTQKGADTTLKALELGAVDFIPKPQVENIEKLMEMSSVVINKVKVAAKSKVIHHDEYHQVAKVKSYQRQARRLEDKVIAFGSSTGGVTVVNDILLALPEKIPAVIIAQHMPPEFTGSFARRLDNEVKHPVYEAENMQEVKSGAIYIAPGGKNLQLKKRAGSVRFNIFEDSNQFSFQPSVDVLLSSVAKLYNKNALGIMLTGMGRDGAEGMKEMRDSGACTLAQDERSSLIWGMPGAAVELDAVTKVLSPTKIVEHISYFIAEDKKLWN